MVAVKGCERPYIFQIPKSGSLALRHRTPSLGCAALPGGLYPLCSVVCVHLSITTTTIQTVLGVCSACSEYIERIGRYPLQMKFNQSLSCVWRDVSIKESERSRLRYWSFLAAIYRRRRFKFKENKWSGSVLWGFTCYYGVEWLYSIRMIRQSKG